MTCDEEWEVATIQSVKGDWFAKARLGLPEKVGDAVVHRRFVHTGYHPTEAGANAAIRCRIEMFEAGLRG